jgi:hypothetical protein
MEISDYPADLNQRQYRRMREALAGMPAVPTSISIGSLVGTLEALNCALEGSDAVWRDLFSKGWWVLESAYALALDQGRTRFSEEELSVLNREVRDLSLLVAEKIIPETDLAE